MRSFRNTFRHRTSDQRDRNGPSKFVRSFASDVIDLLPDDRWDRLIVIRSAPGAGKTSLLRAFEPATLNAVMAAPDEYPELAERLTDAGAIVGATPLRLGIRISMRSDFRDLVDLDLTDEGARKLFFRFLDAQIIREFLAAITELGNVGLPAGLARIDLVAPAEPCVWSLRLGGTNGVDLHRWATSADDDVRRLLDSVLPISTAQIDGHSELYSLRALSEATITVDDVEVDVQPLLMIDDGQWLAPSQRRALLSALVDRELTLARWYTERHDALDPDEIIGDGEPARRHRIHALENETRKMGGGTTSGGRRIRAFEAMLLDVADFRAARPLIEYGDDSDTSFAGHLEGASEIDDEVLRSALQTLQERVLASAAAEPRYQEWIESIPSGQTVDAAVRWREVEILVARDVDRPQLQLLDLPLDEDERKKRSSSAIRETARLFLLREFKIPYYFGAETVAKLGDHNFDQFLRLSGDLFDEMLALLTLGRRPVLSPSAQQRVLTVASAQMWREIPQRRSHGRNIQHVLSQIGAFAQKETYRPKASYAPGVSGVALSMRDRARLLEPDFRSRTPGAQELFDVLGGAVGHNLLNATLDHQNKGDQWMVLYLNRLLCVRYGLPIGLGGWRPFALENMCEWLADPPTGDLSGESVDDQLLLDF